MKRLHRTAMRINLMLNQVAMTSWLADINAWNIIWHMLQYSCSNMRSYIDSHAISLQISRTFWTRIIICLITIQPLMLNEFRINWKVDAALLTQTRSQQTVTW
jgi:hypothetical protein